MEALVLDRPPNNWYDVRYQAYYSDFTGQSFLINPYTLVAERNRWKYKEIAQYVALASFRSYAYYATTQDKSLDLLHSPVGEDIINQNRLLSIKDGRVHFQYEEVTRRNLNGT